MASKDGIRFTIGSTFGFFKKPDVNQPVYFTYSHIHKVALLGVLGSVIGLGGHQQQDKEKETFPEFYDKLNGLKVSIVPTDPSGYFRKKIQVFNNDVGYANTEGTLNVKEQWLEKPSWDVYVYQGTVEDEVYEKLKDYLLNEKAVYLPYLGKNDHLASITNVSSVKLKPIEVVQYCNSLVAKDEIELKNEVHDYYYELNEDVNPIYLREMFPFGLNKDTCQYDMKNIVFSNLELERKNKKAPFYQVGSTILFFM